MTNRAYNPSCGEWVILKTRSHFLSFHKKLVVEFEEWPDQKGHKGAVRKMKDASPILLVNSRRITDILESAFLSVNERYFYGNSEAYGNFQDEEYPPGNPCISYFKGDA